MRRQTGHPGGAALALVLAAAMAGLLDHRGSRIPPADPIALARKRSNWGAVAKVDSLATISRSMAG